MNRNPWTLRHKPLRMAQTRSLRSPVPFSRPVLITLAICVGVTAAAGGYTYLRYAPLPRGAIIDPSRVTAANGQVLGDLIASGVTRQEVSLSQVPIYLQEATVAVEDTAFYRHNGLNLRGILRALLADIGAGHVVQGGSTITQQLAKNLFLSSDRTIWRKLREAVYALQLELHYSKRQILTDYLNVIYYGDGATGIGTAAEYYFGKPVSQLNLAESALLAGLPKGPSLYNPLTHEALAKERQRAVLQSMVRAGFITQQAAHGAFIEPLHFARHAASESLAPYFTEAVAGDARSQFHLTREDLYRGGMSIHTTLDPTLQRALDQAIHKYIPAASGLEAAAVVMDPQNGNILAYSGGVNFAKSPYDRVNAMRQPGSTFKPFVYATALDHGWTAARLLMSAPKTFHYDQHSVYAVHNFADLYPYAPIDLRQAIAHSDNVYAVSVNMAVGPKRVIDTARLFGLPDDMEPYPSLALGVFPVSPLELARAYSVFANGGYLVKPRMITSVLDQSGQTLYATEPSRLLVESPATAYILTTMMESVMKPGGTAYRIAHLIPGVVAAKTGTTDTDAWIAGYTPSTVCVVWVGYDHMRDLSTAQTHVAAPIFASVMRAAFKQRAQGTFTAPPGVKLAWIDPSTGQLATSACPVREQDAFASGSEPTVTCMTHPAPSESLTDKAVNAFRALWSFISRANP
ncbi:MAG: PBP1A family penicillin-binding protein [Firmicutes bacterium]|nr:PBP1A family penicillin-binding protein [Bacillota bacterium]